MLLKELRILFWTSSYLVRASWSLARSSWSLALASLSSIISFSNRWIYSTDELEEVVVTREEEGLMPSPFTLPDVFLNTKFEISSCVRGIALRSWQWSTCTLRIFSYHLKERKKQTITNSAYTCNTVGIRTPTPKSDTMYVPIAKEKRITLTFTTEKGKSG